MTVLPVFIGVDPRQPIAYHVLCSSIQRRSSKPVALIPLLIDQLPITRVGLTDFTYARYIVPHLMGYQGKAVFLDSDMLVLGDIAELFDVKYDTAVSVVPFDGKLGFERPSVMVFNCDLCRDLTPEYIDNPDSHPQSFEWALSVGRLPMEWNHLVGYSQPSDNVKLVHYTQGVPGYLECRMCEYSDEWFREKEIMNSHVSWLEIMGNSVHAQPVLNRLKGHMNAN
jgi:hypothetical protein